MANRTLGAARREAAPARSCALSCVALLTVLVLLVSPGCAGFRQPAQRIDKAGGRITPHPVELRLLNTRGEEAQPFLHAVTRLSGGSLALTSADDKFERGSLTSETDALHALQSGQADVAIVPTRAFDSVGGHSFDALMDPMLIDSMALQQQVLADRLTEVMVRGVSAVGLVGVGVLPGPIRLPDGITRPMLGQASYVGARIATSPSAISERSLRALGAVPVPWGFEGADVSRFDALDQQATSVAGNSYDGTVRWITTNVGLWPRPLAVVANARSWAGLGSQQHAWLRRAAKDAVAPTAASQLDPEALSTMCRRHRVKLIRASNEQIAQLRHAFAPVERWLRTDRTTRDHLDRIHTLKKQLPAADPGQPIDCAALTLGQRRAIAGSSSPATAIDGEYTQSYTAAEVQAAGVDPNPIPENWGEFRLVLDRGRFASTQSNAQACTWNYGTYTLRGQTLTLTMADGGGQAPTGAANKPGEVFTYTVSSYRGLMKWSTVPGAVSPGGSAFKPWERQTTQPWTQFLDKRCLPPRIWVG